MEEIYISMYQNKLQHIQYNVLQYSSRNLTLYLRAIRNLI